jgi:hypothetical protein
MEERKARLLSKTRDPDREREFDEVAEKRLREISPEDADQWMRFRIAFRVSPYTGNQAKNYLESVFQALLEMPSLRNELKGRKIEIGIRHDGSMVDAEMIGPVDGKYFLLITEANIRLKIAEIALKEILRAFHPDWEEEKLEEEVKKAMEICRIAAKGW